MVMCSKCKGENERNAWFCNSCGDKVKSGGWRGFLADLVDRHHAAQISRSRGTVDPQQQAKVDKTASVRDSKEATRPQPSGATWSQRADRVFRQHLESIVRMGASTEVSMDRPTPKVGPPEQEVPIEVAGQPEAVDLARASVVTEKEQHNQSSTDEQSRAADSALISGETAGKNEEPRRPLTNEITPAQEVEQLPQPLSDAPPVRLSSIEAEAHEQSPAAGLTEQGRELLDQGKAREAVDLFTKAIAQDPVFKQAWESRAAAYDQLGRRASAAGDRRRATVIANSQ